MTTTQPADTIAAIRERAKAQRTISDFEDLAEWTLIVEADRNTALSRYDEACAHVRALLQLLTLNGNGNPTDVVDAQAFLSGTPTDGAQGGEGNRSDRPASYFDDQVEHAEAAIRNLAKKGQV